MTLASWWTDRARGWVVIAALILATIFALSPSLPATAADSVVQLSGRVTIGDGTTAPTVGDVRVHYAPQTAGYAGITSPYVSPDASGNYVITTAPGNYTIFFEYLGPASVASMFFGGALYGQSTAVTADASVSNLDMTLPPRAVYSGQVSLGAAGAHPGPGVVIAFTPDTDFPGAPMLVQTTTAADGAFSVALDPGFYEASFTAVGYQVQYLYGGMLTTMRARVPIGVVSRSGLDLTLPAPGTIAGHVDTGVSGHPAISGQVKVSYSGQYVNSLSGSVLTDSGGDYLITGLNSDRYTLTFTDVADTEYQSPTVGDPVEVRDDTLNVTAPDTTMPSTASITGQVYLGDTNHPAGAGEVEVALNGPNSDGSLPTFAAQTDATGRYTISGLQSGTYPLLWFHYAGAGQYADEYWQDSYQPSTATPVTVTTTSVVRDATLAASGSLSGSLSPATASHSTPGVSAYFVDSDGNRSGQPDSSAKVNSDGTFQFAKLRPGSYDLRFIDVNQWYHQTSTMINGETVTVAAGANTDLGINVVKTPATLHGTVTCAGCVIPTDAVQTASIDARATPTSPWISVGTVTADPSGFIFSGLMPGEYRVHYLGGHGCIEVISGAVTVAEGQTVEDPMTIQCGSVGLTLPSGPPRGSLDAAGGGVGTVTVAGWALDPDQSDPIPVAFYVDGVFTKQTNADQTRSDIGAAFPGYGSVHGFSLTLVGVGATSGLHTVCAYAINVGPLSPNTTLGCRTVSITVVNPIGSLDSVAAAPGSVALSGWTLDADAKDTMRVNVYVDGLVKADLAADGVRTDVGNAYPGTGTTHGYSTTLTGLATGMHTVCTYGINQGSGTNVLLGCRSVTVLAGSPLGSFDAASIAGPGVVTVSGWALDPDTAASISVQAYIDGAFSTQLTADGVRPDIAGAFPGYGSAHGFSSTLSGLAGGTHTICLYGINQLAGSNSTLGCKTVTVPTGSPFGSVDSVMGSSGGIAISGWALDPDVAASIDVHVYVDGKFNSVVTASGTRSDIASAFPGYDPAHGFSSTVSALVGTHAVCVYGINQGATGSNSMIGNTCSQAIVPAG